MGKSPAFQFYPRDWLGDPEIMLMDWDAKAMHLHCICIAWLHTDACALPDDDALLCKWLNIQNDADWVERLKPQIFSAWSLEDGCWIQKRLKREKIKQLERSSKMKNAAKSRWNKGKNTDANAMQKHMQMQCSSSSSSTAVDKEKNKQKKKEKWHPPKEVNLQVWQEFEQHRKEIKKPLTDQARTKNANILKSLTESQQRQCVDTTIANRWTGIFPPKQNKAHKGNGNGSAEDLSKAYQAEFGEPPPVGKSADEVRQIIARKRDKQSQWYDA